MKALKIEFVRSEPRLPRVLLALSAVVGVLALSALVPTAGDYAALQLLRVDSQALQSKTSHLTAEVVQARQPQTYATGALQAVKVASFPTEKALVALESASEPGVRVVALKVQPGQGSAQADIEAQSPESLAAYLRQTVASTEPGWRLLKVQGTTATAAASLVNQIPPGLPPLIPQALPPGGGTGSASSATLVWQQSAP